METKARKALSLKLAAAFGACLLLLAGFTVYLWQAGPHPRMGGLKKATFHKLKKFREVKKQEILEYFKEAGKLAGNIRGDKQMVAHFMKLRKDPALLTPRTELDLDQRYVTRYGVFYDILFLDEKGNVFFSIKKEGDLGTNLMNGPLSGSAIGRQLRDKTSESFFVDYEYYQPSEEPASFYINAVKEGERLLGWFVLQLPINGINAILNDYQGLGRTGEVYLVNRKALMLSESRFIPDGTILRQRVDTLAVKAAVKEGVGDRIILDYRGVRVFSSYEAFNTGETTWIIIAEMDEDEVITEYYRANKRHLKDRLWEHLARHQARSGAGRLPKGRSTRVDINEFAECGPEGRLATFGVATCTAVAITFSDRFAYLAHIPPTARIYRSKGLFGFLKGRAKGTDLLDGLIRRIRRYRVYPYQLRQLRFTLVAPHRASFEGAVETILDQGLELSSIRIIYDQRAVSANVVVDMAADSIVVGWNRGSARPHYETAGKRPNLGEMVKEVIGYRS